MTIETSFSRRHFITGTLAASAAAALGLAGCAPQTPADKAMPTPALVMNCRRVYFPIFHSLVVGVFAPG